LASDLKIKEKSFMNIGHYIDKSKSNSLEKLIFGIGIRHVGETTAKVLAKTFRDIDILAKATLAELLQVNDIGETVAISIKDYFENENNKQLIAQLIHLGVNSKYISNFNEADIDKNSPYYHKTFVITGSFEIPRHLIKQLLEQKFDANVVETITRTTDYLIAGENGGSKLEKATKLGIKIINDKI
jgi:DNA ligase (NAD+)